MDGFVHVFVIGVIVDKNNMVVVVFLLEDRQDCFFVSVLRDVVVAEDSHAEWDLFLCGLVSLYVVNS